MNIGLDMSVPAQALAAESLEWVRLEMLAAGIDRPLLVPMVGNPIAQVKAPALLNPRFEEDGISARLVSIEIPLDEFENVFGALLALPDVIASVITVPFKFRAAGFCQSLDRAAALAGAANMLTRNAAGNWHGAMTDGDGFVAALKAAGFDPIGRKVYIAGAGGVGSGIAAALVLSGVSSIDVFDPEREKTNRLQMALGINPLGEPPATMSGYDLLINATALGLDANDPLPFDPSTASRSAFIGDVVAEPEVTQLRAVAAAHGQKSIGGLEMLKGQIDALYNGIAAAAVVNR